MKSIIFALFTFILLSVQTMSVAYATEIAYKSPVVSARLADESLYISDERVDFLYKFLEQYNSPLKENSEDFIRFADQYELDWRLLASISGVESTFGKHLPYNSYNAWGWGIYGDNMIRFSSYEEAIATISKELRLRYIDKWGAQNVHQIGRYYAASPTWAQRVVYFMEKIDNSYAINGVDDLSMTL